MLLSRWKSYDEKKNDFGGRSKGKVDLARLDPSKPKRAKWVLACHGLKWERHRVNMRIKKCAPFSNMSRSCGLAGFSLRFLGVWVYVWVYVRGRG